MNLDDSLSAVAVMAERKILEAMAEGQFDNLPGRGRPQKLEDLSHLPPELRMTYMVLKNSGFLNETEGGPKPAGLRDLLFKSSAEGRDCGKLERLKFFLTRARREEGGGVLEDIEPEYLDKLLRKV